MNKKVIKQGIVKIVLYFLITVIVSAVLTLCKVDMKITLYASTIVATLFVIKSSKINLLKELKKFKKEYLRNMVPYYLIGLSLMMLTNFLFETFKLVETGGTTHTAECQTEKVDITNETITAITTDKASIKSVEINGQCVNNISAGTFSGCDSLISVRMSEGVNTVGGFGALTDIYPCNNITSIGPVGSGASVEIPNSVKTIGSNAFSWSRGLTDVTIPSNVETISTSAFTATIVLTSCTFQENSNLKTIENYAFAYAKFTTLDIPSSVTKIGIYCFTECGNLETVTLPPNITILNQGAFNHCSGLTSIDIPDAVTAIGDWAFEKCTALTSVTIGTGITQINQSFRSCSSLTSFTIKAVTPPALDGTAFSGMANCPIYVPSGSVEAYKTADVWSNYASRIQAIP